MGTIVGINIESQTFTVLIDEIAYLSPGNSDILPARSLLRSFPVAKERQPNRYSGLSETSNTRAVNKVDLHHIKGKTGRKRSKLNKEFAPDSYSKYTHLPLSFSYPFPSSVYSVCLPPLQIASNDMDFTSFINLYCRDSANH